MTLIISLACNDGIVMASDGQATSPSSGGFIRRNVAKINPIGSNILWGGSGSVGTLQKISKCLNDIKEDLEKKGINDQNVRQDVLNRVFALRSGELNRHRTLYGPNNDEGAQVADLLISEYNGKNPRIWHITPDAADEFLEEMGGFGCTGNGDIFAYAYLNNFVPGKLSVQEGSVLAFRVIRQAIDVGAFGLGMPIHIWQITEKGVKRCRTEEIEAIMDTYYVWLEAEREIFKKVFMTSKKLLPK